jgi:hypothetical protein
MILFCELSDIFGNHDKNNSLYEKDTPLQNEGTANEISRGK